MVSPCPPTLVRVSKFDNFDCARRQIIEVDGVDVEPYTVDNFPISVAQRYSVLVTAKNVTDQNYILHANFDPQMFDAVPDDLQLSASHSIVLRQSRSQTDLHSSRQTTPLRSRTVPATPSLRPQRLSRTTSSTT